jgi:uncharacterized protein YodC (DUF2158 family)
MAHEEIAAGKRVRLKSGGPPMTVEQLGDRYGEPVANCAWFDGKALKRESFPLPALEVLTDD